MICIADQFAGHHAHDTYPPSFRAANQCQLVLSANPYPAA